MEQQTSTSTSTSPTEKKAEELSVDQRVLRIARRVNIDPYQLGIDPSQVRATNSKALDVNESIRLMAFLLQQEAYAVTTPPDVVTTLAACLSYLAESVELDGTVGTARFQCNLREAAGVAQRLDTLLECIGEYTRPKPKPTE